jgi:hypothetical protein
MTTACTGSLEKDLATLCDTVEEVKTAKVARPHVMEWYSQRVQEKGLSSDGAALWQSLGALPPEQRYAGLLSGAADHGITDWSCPPLQELFARR